MDVERARGPIETAHGYVAFVAGDMSLAITRREAPPARVAEWLKSLEAAVVLLKERAG